MRMLLIAHLKSARRILIVALKRVHHVMELTIIVQYLHQKMIIIPASLVVFALSRKKVETACRLEHGWPSFLVSCCLYASPLFSSSNAV